MVIALLLSLLIGLSLGLLGGGGSILTVPILVYALGVPAKSAIATSLLVVGVTSLAAVVSHARAGQVRWKVAAVFGSAAMAGAYAGGLIARFIPPAVLLIMFGALMLVTAAAMLRGRRVTPPDDGHAGRRTVLAVIEGLVVGVVTGMVGAGGGFLVVPALVLLAGLPMRAAVGTSLVIIAMKSFAAFAGYVGHVDVDWTLAGVVTAAAVAGSLAGGWLSRKVPQDRLRQAFAWFVVAMGAYVIGRELPDGWLDRVVTAVPILPSLAGGVLIGLAAATMLLLNGRIAGVSGIAGGLLTPRRGDTAWRALFVAGLIAGGAIMSALFPALFGGALERSALALGAAGLLVGVGTTLGNGCTSGHGVCGVSRLSPRSLAATGVFMLAGVVTATFVGRIFGGVL